MFIGSIKGTMLPRRVIVGTFSDKCLKKKGSSRMFEKFRVLNFLMWVLLGTFLIGKHLLGI